MQLHVDSNTRSQSRAFPEPLVRFYAAELVSALGHLHSLDIVYRYVRSRMRYPTTR